MTDEEQAIAAAVQATRKRRHEAVVEDEAPEYVEVLIDLPAHAPDVRLDGRIFQPGMTYKVDLNQARSLKDIMFRAWAHEQEVRGQRTGFAPKARNYTLRG